MKESEGELGMGDPWLAGETRPTLRNACELSMAPNSTLRRGMAVWCSSAKSGTNAFADVAQLVPIPRSADEKSTK